MSEEKQPEPEKSKKRKIFELIYNPISLFGIAICGFGLGMIIIFTVIGLILGDRAPYLGLLNFVILPPFIILGLIIIPIGAIRFQKRLHKYGAKPQPYMKLDLNLPHHRKNFVVFVFVTFVICCGIGVLSYQGYHYTESVEFCSTCHSVMSPQSTTHQTSPHARVSCAECHIGSGAGWYIKSKLSGLYQVYSLFAEKYPKPIPTPIHNLRPARDTCETCHWPNYFIEDKVWSKNYFLTDEENTSGRINLLMKIGGQPDFGVPSGIHWHMLAEKEVTFKAADEGLQIIPVVWEKFKVLMIVGN